MRLRRLGRIVRGATLLAVSAVLLAIMACSCGTGPEADLRIWLSDLVVRLYLAPGEDAEFPTTGRIKFWVLDKNLPVHSATFDRDDDGPTAPVGVELHAMGKSGPTDGGTSYYFDYEWNGPEGIIGKLTVRTAGGTFSERIELRLEYLELLPLWPF